MAELERLKKEYDMADMDAYIAAVNFEDDVADEAEVVAQAAYDRWQEELNRVK